MNLLDRYLGKVILQYAALTMAVLLGLFAFVGLLDQLSDLGRGRYDFGDALMHVALEMPRNLYALFPIAALLGVMLGLSLLANDWELTALRASGVSVWQIAIGVTKIGALLAGGALLVGEFVAPNSELRAQSLRVEAMRATLGGQIAANLWLRDQNAYINLGEVRADLTARNIRLFEFDDDKNLRTLLHAQRGRFDADHWRLSDVRQTRFEEGDDDNGATVAQFDSLNWQSAVTPKLLSVFLLDADQLSLRQLSRYLNHLKQNRQQTAKYELAFWQKLLAPLSVVLMMLLAIPFVFANVRAGALARSLFVGVMLGLGFSVGAQGVGYLTLAINLPAPLGAMLPQAAVLLFALWLMKRVG